MRSDLEATTSDLDLMLQRHATGANVHLLNNVRGVLRTLQFSWQDSTLPFVEVFLREFPPLMSEVSDLLGLLAHVAGEEGVYRAEAEALRAKWELLVLAGTPLVNHLVTLADPDRE